MERKWTNWWQDTDTICPTEDKVRGSVASGGSETIYYFITSVFLRGVGGDVKAVAGSFCPAVRCFGKRRKTTTTRRVSGRDETPQGSNQLVRERFISWGEISESEQVERRWLICIQLRHPQRPSYRSFVAERWTPGASALLMSRWSIFDKVKIVCLSLNYYFSPIISSWLTSCCSFVCPLLAINQQWIYCLPGIRSICPWRALQINHISIIRHTFDSTSQRSFDANSLPFFFTIFRPRFLERCLSYWKRSNREHLSNGSQWKWKFYNYFLIQLMCFRINKFQRNYLLLLNANFEDAIFIQFLSAKELIRNWNCLQLRFGIDWRVERARHPLRDLPFIFNFKK